MSRENRGSSPSCVVVNFHHARGPEVEHWIGEGESPLEADPQPEYVQVLPFLALPDGAHSTEEDFSYFTLKASEQSTLFGISCTRQLDSRELIERPVDVTRSTVQKAVVVIANDPTLFFGHLKQQLSAVTAAWFAQKNFEDMEIIRRFQESLQSSLETDQGRDQYVGLSLRELIFEFKHQTLVLFKCMLLQPKMLFFGARCEKLCMIQFSLLSLIPGLLRHLGDCSDPEFNTYESTLTKPTSVKSSDRKSLLTFMGLPLQIFGKGSLFGPYTPLQQLDILADVGTKSYMVGSTNPLLLQQRDRYSDILINLDEHTVNITSPSLRSALSLSAADRRWIDALVNAVQESWDESDPSRTKTMGFVGSDDYIRLQFEEYLLSLVSSVKYHLFLEKHAGSDMNVFLRDVEGDPAQDYNIEWVDSWKKTENFRIFQKFTDSEIFDLIAPRHLMAGGLSFEDVQRRISQQVSELHIDERVNNGKEALARTWASSRNNFSAAITNLSKNVEKFREQRKAQEQAEASDGAAHAATAPTSPTVGGPGVLSSWAAWAAEKRQKAFSGTTSPPPERSSVYSAVSESEKTERARSGIFSLNRWSKSSSLDTPEPKTPRTGSSSQEIVRETVWEDIPPEHIAGPVGLDENGIPLHESRPAPIDIVHVELERPLPLGPRDASPEVVTSPPFILPKALSKAHEEKQLPLEPAAEQILKAPNLVEKELPEEPKEIGLPEEDTAVHTANSQPASRGDEEPEESVVVQMPAPQSPQVGHEEPTKEADVPPPKAENVDPNPTKEKETEKEKEKPPRLTPLRRTSVPFAKQETGSASPLSPQKAAFAARRAMFEKK